jgi:Trp operon repressor
MQVPDELVFNFLCDLKKKDIDPLQRSRIIQKYMEENALSQRELSKQMGIPHSTIQDWLLFLRVSEEEYKELLNKGVKHTEIYRQLRNNKKMMSKEFLSKSTLDIRIENAISQLRQFTFDNPPHTTKTVNLMNELINVCNRILMKIERG